MTSRATSKRRRNLSRGSGTKSLSPPLIDIKEVIDHAKVKFEGEQKSVSAPTSPKSLTVETVPSEEQPTKRARLMRSSLSPKAGRRSSLLMTASTTSVSGSSVVTATTTTTTTTPTSESCLVEAPSSSSATNSPNQKMFMTSTDPKINPTTIKKVSKGVSMSEVIRLHQDEGVMHLLHGLPSSRSSRKNSQVVSVNQSTPAARRRPSAEVERGPRKGMAQSSNSDAATAAGGKSNISAVRAVLAQRMINDQNVLSVPLDTRNIKQCNQEELMTPTNLEILKQLPTKDYVKLWSSPARYVLSRDRIRLPSGEEESTSQASPSGSVTSLESSVSSAAIKALGLKPFVRSSPWKLNTKNYKDVLIRTYSSFAQIIISPSTTGLKQSINANVCEELTDALRQLSEDSECRAILVTGIGGAFCNGVDYTVLANDGSLDKQRKNAEALANGIKKLVKRLLDTRQILVGAVNGRASGLGVGLLPYFDIVYASDKAEFSLEYARLGHIPEAFASQTKVAECRELMLNLTKFTATMAKEAGLVSDVILPNKFLEEIVPKLESLELMSKNGLRILSKCLMKSMKERVYKVIEDETKELITQWSSLEFAKFMKSYIKSGHLSFI